MQIISGCTDFKLEEKSAVAIGKFDGIHRGHQELLSYILIHLYYTIFFIIAQEFSG